MNCLNCGGTEFEKADYEGKFTLPFSYKPRGWSDEKFVDIPKYNHACLGCGLVQGFIDIDARQAEMKNLIDYALEDQLVGANDTHDEVIERISVRELSEMTKIPRPHIDELSKELLQDHRGYNTVQILNGCDRLIPILQEDEGDLWIVGERH